MNEDQIQQALFTQQRIQIMHLGQTADKFTDPYLFAWVNGVYPFYEDTDGTVMKMPHEHYQNCFMVSKQLGEKTLHTLDDLFTSNKVPTFWELEDQFNINSHDENEDGLDRGKLIDIIRYCFLSNRFNKEFYKSLLTPMEHPGEATYITRAFDRDSELRFM